MPKTKIKTGPSLSDALFGRTQQRVLAMLFGEPHRGFLTSDIISRARSGSGAVQRELARLRDSGLVTVEVSGRQKTYRANPAAPIFEELCNIVRKTFGVAEPLREALAPLMGAIDAAFIYGSVASRQDSADSDIDLLVVSDTLTYADLYGALETARLRIDRTIDAKIYSAAEMRRKASGGTGFVKRLLTEPKIWLKGDADGLGL